MLHFTPEEFADRAARLRAEMARRGLSALLLFAPESQFWLSGHDTFGYCFFQCLVVTEDRMALLTRSADLRQARLTSILDDVRVWKDGEGADPSVDLWDLLAELGLEGRRLGWETDTHGLTHWNGRRVAERLEGRVTLADASDLVSALRLRKSPAEIACVRRAAAQTDAAWEAALPLIGAGAWEGDVLAALQGAIFADDGDFPGNPVVIGSADHALLCRYASGRRRLSAQDQITVEWSGSYRHHHAAAMRTAVVGAPREAHLDLHAAAEEALLACEAELRPGRTMGDVFAAHVRVFEARGLSHARLNACGYAMGARFAPSWMEREMFFEGAETELAPGMAFFLHMILMDDRTGCAMCLGRSSLVTEGAAEPLSRLPLALDLR